MYLNKKSTQYPVNSVLSFKQQSYFQIYIFVKFSQFYASFTAPDLIYKLHYHRWWNHVEPTDMSCARVTSCLNTGKFYVTPSFCPSNVRFPRVQRRQLFTLNFCVAVRQIREFLHNFDQNYFRSMLKMSLNFLPKAVILDQKMSPNNAFRKIFDWYWRKTLSLSLGVEMCL